MNIWEWLQLFITQLKETSVIEWAGVSFGVAEVLFAKANKIWLYPSGIISVVLSSYVFVISGLYAESLLNVYYLLMSIYGWWYWIKKKNGPVVPISWCTPKEWAYTVGIVVISLGILYYSLSRYTNSTVPFWDAWVSSTAWAGMWLLAKRKMENWILLNISNAFAIPLLLYKQLPLYALLTLFLFIIAVQGYIQWKNIIATTSKTNKRATMALH